eukprot:6149189-Alexandrium_andersonii.AAC.1
MADATRNATPRRPGPCSSRTRSRRAWTSSSSAARSPVPSSGGTPTGPTPSSPAASSSHARGAGRSTAPSSVAPRAGWRATWSGSYV